jgi:hypothetical protein
MSGSEDTFGLLDEAHAALRGVMAALNGGAPDDPAVTTALVRLSAASDAVGDPAALAARVRVSEHGRLRAALEEWLRLSALTTALAARDRERLEERFEHAREGRRSLAALRPVNEAIGRSCDLSA